MARSTKESWLQGPGDLREAEVDDVPVPGESVLVRGLSARYSAEIQAQLKLEQVGGSQVAKIDVASMELLQFVHGVVEPRFTVDEAKTIQERFGPAFKKVIAAVDDLSGIDKEAIREAAEHFPDGGVATPGSQHPDANGNGRPDLHVRAGA